MDRSMIRPNIIVLSLDSLRPDHLSVYGYQRETTPNLKKFCERYPVTRFEQAFSTSAWTLPAHASVFTGKYPSEHGVFDRYDELDSSKTFAAIGAQEDYRTSAFLNNGWLVAGNITDDFETRHKYFQIHDPKPRYERFVEKLSTYLALTDSGAKRTITAFFDWLDSDDTPFVSFLQFMEPHYLYTPPRPYHREFTSTLSSRIQQIRKQERIFHNRPGYLSGAISLTPKELDLFRDLYDSAILYLDSQLQQLFAGLRDRGLMNNTLIIILGDHGEHFGEASLVGHHFSLSDALLNIPLLIKWPQDNASAPLESYGGSVDHTDVFELITNTLSSNPRSYDILSKCADNRLHFARYQVPAHIKERFPEKAGGEEVLEQFPDEISVVRRNNYKLIRTPEGERLVDTTVSVSNRQDVLGEHSQIAMDLRTALDHHIDNSPTGRTTTDGNLPAGLKQHLERMGYLQR